MKIPKKIKVGALWYEIELFDDIPENQADTDYSKLRIRIEADAKPEAQEVAFWHEVFHALNGELSETEVDWLAHGVHQVLTDNKLLK